MVWVLLIPLLEMGWWDAGVIGVFWGFAPRKRGADLLARLVSHGGQGVRVRRLGGSRAGEMRITRFLRNPAVTVDEMIGTGFARTVAACRGRDILAIQDTTVTRADGSSGGGSFLHAMIAVDAQSGAVLGAIDAQFLERSSGGKASRLARPHGLRQSIRWLQATERAGERAGEITGAARVMMVADREADIFDLFAHRPAHVDLLVRAMHDRALTDGGKLAAQISQSPCLGTATLTVPAGPGRPARAATLAIRFGEFSLKPPRDRRDTCVTPVEMTCVDLLETAPPEGVKPLHWRLLTTRRITSVDAALALAELYTRRWRIEDVFRTMKSKGFDIEHLNIADITPRNRLITACLITACLIAATVVMQMTSERDGLALRPLTDAFDPEDQPLLEIVSQGLEGRTERQKNPHPKASLAFASWVCARLGGWTGYYGKPGPIVILRGWSQFQSIKQGAILAAKPLKQGQKLV